MWGAARARATGAPRAWRSWRRSCAAARPGPPGVVLLQEAARFSPAAAAARPRGASACACARDPEAGRLQVVTVHVDASARVASVARRIPAPGGFAAALLPGPPEAHGALLVGPGGVAWLAAEFLSRDADVAEDAAAAEVTEAADEETDDAGVDKMDEDGACGGAAGAGCWWERDGNWRFAADAGGGGGEAAEPFRGGPEDSAAAGGRSARGRVARRAGRLR